MNQAYAVGGVLMVATSFVANYGIVHLVRKGIERQVAFTDQRPLDVLKEALRQRAESQQPSEGFASLPSVVPFDPVKTFDPEADSWSQLFSSFAGGVAVFDANDDGRLDVYFLQDGQNWTRPTDDGAVLQERPRYQRNVLYLNRGNDAEGWPVFKRVDELAGSNAAGAELLVEGYLFPRTAVTDTLERPGRKATGVLVADLNNDGRPDLLVGNKPVGMLWSHPKTRQILTRFVNPQGRTARHSRIPLKAMGQSMIHYEPSEGTEDSWDTARGRECQGTNSLYLNTGDGDGDGVPEWRDATLEAGIGGCGASYGLVAADIDLDGDLDVYVANAMDDDYWPGDSRYWAGGANDLFINQLAETGQLTFVNRAAEMKVDEVHDKSIEPSPMYRLKTIPFLPKEYSVLLGRFEPYRPAYLVLDGKEGQHAEISWAAQFQDVNGDGYPDLWVANDLAHLRLYLNDNGKRFVESKNARSHLSGSWMSLTAADFNGDLHEDMFAGNLGGGMLSNSLVAPDPFDAFEPVLVESLGWAQFLLGTHDTTHALIDGADYHREMPHKVRHSSILPPDASLPNNVRPNALRLAYHRGEGLPPFDQDGIGPYEFTWGSATLDAQNDGRPDLYFLGCLYNRGGGLWDTITTNPGRLLINATPSGGALRFADLTAEHQAFNIDELKYDRLLSDGYVYRRAPAQNWGKRDVVFSYDRSTWMSQGIGIVERVTNHDLIQTAEYGRSVVAADLNGDGFQDLVLTNQGGYDSRSSRASNLKVMLEGRPQVLPAPDFNYPTLTNFEPGRVRVLLNRYRENRWIKVRLVDDSPATLNRDAVGARVTVNGRHMQVKRAGTSGYLGTVYDDVAVGLGQQSVTAIDVEWPDMKRSVSRLRLDGLSNGILTVSKTKGLLRWQPLAGSKGGRRLAGGRR